jgi:hypothetical protein
MADSSRWNADSKWSRDGGWEDSSAPSRPAPNAGSSVCRLVKTLARKRGHALSSLSSETQAKGRSSRRSHSLSMVVLPKPAGAETSVSFASSPALSRPTNRGRGTCSRRIGGTVSLVWLRSTEDALAETCLGSIIGRVQACCWVAARLTRGTKPPEARSKPHPTAWLVTGHRTQRTRSWRSSLKTG